MIGQMISLALALLGAAAVYGTDVFFWRRGAHRH